MWQGFRAAAVVAAVAVLAAFVFHNIWPEEGSTQQPEVQGKEKERLEVPTRGLKPQSTHRAPESGPPRNQSKPLLLAIMGEVYDVGPGARFYDASRAMSTGNFKEDATPSLHGFSKEQVADVMQWRSFYRNHEQYRFVGFLQGPYLCSTPLNLPLLTSESESPLMATLD
ncbi:Neuferricin-like [Symbiodinium microadriaticum]|uniref:Neuferricin-like n=1 Tax=Symbiodinium microadriaticum TaxID=2951 RepID=A0A1Q9F004_SYMMI|nr:Neuferricin-like [Symbiodinium microadriaticum]